MKNLIVITSLLTAGTLATNAATTLKYEKAGNFYYRDWCNDNEIMFYTSNLNQFSGFYTFKASGRDFSKLKSAIFNIYLLYCEGTNLKIWAVELENTDLDATIATEIIKSVDQSSGFVSTSLTSTQDESMLSINITSILQKITKGKDVAILLGITDDWVRCDLDYGKGPRTTLSVEFAAVPEPSMFGLFAGTLALVLAGTRRRRK